MKKINLIYLRSKISSDNRDLFNQKNEFENKLKEQFEIDESGDDYFFIESGGTEEEFKNIYLNFKEPYKIIATTANNSLPAALEICSFLNNKNKRYYLYHADIDNILDVLSSKEDIKKNNDNYIINNKTNLLKNKKYGVIGRPSDWLISSNVDYLTAKERFGVELIDISFDEFKEEIEKAQSVDNEEYRSKLNNKVNLDTLDVAMRIYVALKNIILKHDLNGLTVRCFDLLGSIHNTSCLALAILNKEGYVATCEGDVPAMLSMAVIKEAFNESSFQVNPSLINVNERYGYFAHCTIPLDMCLDYSFDTHFESGLGIGIKGELALGDVTVFKMNSSLDKYEIFKGRIISNLHKTNLCRTQVKISFDEDIDNLLNKPCGNHLIIFRGNHKEEIINIFSQLKK